MRRGCEREPYRQAPKSLLPRPKQGRTSSAEGIDHLEAFRSLIKVRSGICRGETIANTLHSAKNITVLLEGMACVASRHEDGARQIYTFQHAGDFLGLHGFLHPDSSEHCEIEALSNCVVGTIDRATLDEAIQRHPALGRALWRAAMIEASICRQRLLMMRWPARQRVAHLLCEQLSRLAPDSRVVPLNQIEIADTVGLSVVHTNRVFQDLRGLGVLSGKRCIEVVDMKRLKDIAAFDGRYLDAREFMFRWDLRIEG